MTICEIGNVSKRTQALKQIRPPSWPALQPAKPADLIPRERSERREGERGRKPKSPGRDPRTTVGRTSKNKRTVKSSFLNMETGSRLQVNLQEIARWLSCFSCKILACAGERRGRGGAIGRKTSTSLCAGRTDEIPCRCSRHRSSFDYMPSLLLGQDQGRDM